VVLHPKLLDALKLVQLLDMIKVLLPKTAMWSHGNVVLPVLLLLGNVVTMTVEASSLVIRLLQEVQPLGPKIVDVEAKVEATHIMVAKMAIMLLLQHPPLLLGNNKLLHTLLLHLADTRATLHQDTTLLILREVWVHHLVLQLLLDWAVLVLLLSYSNLPAVLHHRLLHPQSRLLLPDLPRHHPLRLISRLLLHQEIKQAD
jgi:hypothetical protein